MKSGFFIRIDTLGLCPARDKPSPLHMKDRQPSTIARDEKGCPSFFIEARRSFSVPHALGSETECLYGPAKLSLVVKPWPEALSRRPNCEEALFKCRLLSVEDDGLSIFLQRARQGPRAQRVHLASFDNRKIFLSSSQPSREG